MEIEDSLFTLIELLFIFVIFALPIICLVLFIKGIVKIKKAKKENADINNSIKITTTIFGIIFLVVIIFYIEVIYSVTMSIAYM